MNEKLNQQILNMKLMVNNFKMFCHYSALADDGQVDPDEQKTLKKIDQATERFLRDLQKISKS